MIFCRNGSVAASQPAQAKPGEAVGLADGAEAEGALVEIASGGKAGGGIVLEFAVDLVGKNIDAMARGKFQDAAENVPVASAVRWDCAAC